MKATTRPRTVEFFGKPVTVHETLCQWFALCDNPAVTTMGHPVLKEVPICQRCADKINGLKKASHEKG